ncbi:tetratricopeptide repeat protein [Streptomyces cahuitamycinicus]|uniref:Uncharacterized protein n=1 Tax=Streptomyces cahuitamycinicus TaxID=2070367 RepID=A0A2N8TXV0_9ACTN|nr:tetratricopeptide repeat protein [Streptomyces cahuitamycinicus]PNG23831.1 hypothetical protein C1J00_01775 [Streptomyces cahuitamycinicus]
MRQFTVQAEGGAVGFSPVRALLRTARTAEWSSRALIGLKLIAPDAPACATIEDKASLTDAARAHDRIRFFLKDRLLRNFRDVGQAWLAETGPCAIDVVGAENLDEGSRLFFETLAELAGTAVTVRFVIGHRDTAQLRAEANERTRRIEKLAAQAAAPAEEDLDFLYEQAVEYLGTGDSWTAERILQAVLRHRSTPSVWGRLGLAYAMLGRTVEAEFCYLRWREDPDAVSAAGAYYGLSMLSARHHPAHLRSLDRAAQFLEKGHQVLESVADETEDLEFHKVFNRNGYALVEFRRGQVREAVAHLTDGIAKLRNGSAKHHMHQTVLMYNLAQCHRRSGNVDAAITTYHQLLSVDGNMPEYHMELASCYLDIGEFTKAYDCLVEARRLGPSIQEVHSLLGFTHLQLGQGVEAVAAYRTAYECGPDHVDALYDYAYALAETDQPLAALQVARKADTGLLPAEQAAKLLTLVAEQNALLGDLTAARTALEEVLILTPDAPDALANHSQVVAAMA